MGNCVGGFKRRTHRIAPWKRNKPIVLCFIGIDGAGKTTIVKALQGEDFGTVHSTVGFSRAELRIKKYRVTVYDLGGSARIREIWPIYFAEVFGVVFVLDSSAASRINENKKMVDTLVGLSDLLGKPILFLLNKKDLPEALDEMQFSERFNLHSMAKLNKTDIRVEGICAVKGTGKEIDQVIVEGLEWIIEKVLDNYDNISKGVEKALKELKERQAQERLERQHRLALSTSKESPEAVGTPVEDDQEEEEEETEKEEDQPEEEGGEGEKERHRASSAHNGQQEETAATQLHENGAIDYGMFEISSKEKEDKSTMGEGRVNETMTIEDEEREKVEKEEKEEGDKGGGEVGAVHGGGGKEKRKISEGNGGGQVGAVHGERSTRSRGRIEGNGGGQVGAVHGERSIGSRGGIEGDGGGQVGAVHGERSTRSRGRIEGNGRGQVGAVHGERSIGSRGGISVQRMDGEEVEAVQGAVEIEMRQTAGRGGSSKSRGESANQRNGDIMAAMEC